MANLNKVFLIGNLTRDPDVRYTPKGTAVADLGLAINRTWTDDQGEKKEETTFVDVTLWGRTAEIAQQYLKKGNPAFVEGHLQLDTWDDKQTGQKRSKLKIIGEHLQLLGSRSQADQPTASSPTGRTKPAPDLRPSSPPPAPQRDPDLDAEPDDIPF